MSGGASPPPPPLSRVVFVSNLPWVVEEPQLLSFFSTAGEVTDVRVLRFKEPPSRSRGFGFVEFRTPAEAAAAVASLNGAELLGRNVLVQVSEPREPRFPRPYGATGARGGAHHSRRTQALAPPCAQSLPQQQQPAHTSGGCSL